MEVNNLEKNILKKGGINYFFKKSF